MTDRLFPAGAIVATPGALEALELSGTNAYVLLARHQRGDWGDLPAGDAKENRYSIKRNLRILSAYELEPGVKVWVITEADRSSTTFLLPSEY